MVEAFIVECVELHETQRQWRLTPFSERVPNPIPVPSNVCMPLWLGVAVLSLFIERAWKRLERLRFSAASGNEHLRALNQPWSDAEALQLPITITLRMARTCVFSAALVFFIALLLFLLVTELVNPVRIWLANWPVNVIALIVLAGSAWGMYVLSMRKRTRIEVSANGIRMYQNTYVDACVS